MLNCQEIEAMLAGYVDGDCAAAERRVIEVHLEVCPPCRARAATERTAREVLRARRDGLRCRAPETLRQRCAAQRQPATAAGSARTAGRRPWVPLSLAATLVFAAGLFGLFGMGSSVETYAAQLAADHIKCFQFPPAAGGADAESLGRTWEASNGWPLRIAPGAAGEQLELIGVRRCASTEGRVAHLLYRWRGQPLSVYVLNGRVEHAADLSHGEHAHDAIRRFGEQEIIWSNRGRTYAVVARASVPELQQLAVYVRQRIE